MARHPVSDEVGAALGAFVAGGSGPRHTTLTRVFARAGYGSAAPYSGSSTSPQPNKEDRVRETVSVAVRDPARSRELVDGLLAEYRVAKFFTPDSNPDDERYRLTGLRPSPTRRCSWRVHVCEMRGRAGPKSPRARAPAERTASCEV